MVRREDIVVDDIDYSAIEAQFQEASFEDHCGNSSLDVSHVLVIDGLPKVPASKEVKVAAILKKVLFDKAGAFVRANGIYFVRGDTTEKVEGGSSAGDDTQVGLGMAFVQFDDAAQMRAALALTDGYVLDKQHTLVAYPFSDIDKLAGLTAAQLERDDEQRLAAEAASRGPRPFAQAWLLDLHCRDQIITIQGGAIEKHPEKEFEKEKGQKLPQVFGQPGAPASNVSSDTVTLWWNERSQPAECVWRVKQGSDGALWSPHGTFLATVHVQGVILWDVNPGSTIEEVEKSKSLDGQIIGHSIQDNAVSTEASSSFIQGSNKEESAKDATVGNKKQPLVESSKREGLSLYRRLAHPHVSVVQFAPNETFATTYSVTDTHTDIIVWHISSGSVVYRIKLPIVALDQQQLYQGMDHAIVRQGLNHVSAVGVSLNQVNMLTWSYDGTYFAYTQNDTLYVYQTAGSSPATLLTSQSQLGISGVAFAPVSLDDLQEKTMEVTSSSVSSLSAIPSVSSSTMLSFWCPESGHAPAKVVVLEVPSGRIRRTKTILQSGGPLTLSWHTGGRHLAVLVHRSKGKQRKTLLPATLEVLHLAEPGVPVHVLTLSGAASLMAWEPTTPSGTTGSLLAILEHPIPEQLPGSQASGRPANTAATIAPSPPSSAPLPSPTVSFYNVAHVDGGSLACIDRLPAKNVTCLAWSPKGKFIVLGSMDTQSNQPGATVSSSLTGSGSSGATGQLYFCSLNAHGTGMEMIAHVEHFMATGMAWDPSGRFLLTHTSILKRGLATESAYMLWDHRGLILRRTPLDKLKIILWRPRPPCLLSPSQQRHITKNLKNYSHQFDLEDAARASKFMALGVASKRQLKDDWEAWRRLARTFWQIPTDSHLSHASSTQHPSHLLIDADITDVVEELLEETEELL